jgi:hypothetical protein
LGPLYTIQSDHSPIRQLRNAKTEMIDYQSIQYKLFASGKSESNKPILSAVDKI